MATYKVSELADLPATVDLMTAARILGIGRTTAYKLAGAGEFPCRVERVGGSYRVPSCGLLAYLGLDPRGRPIQHSS
jgi:hypothetical protein